MQKVLAYGVLSLLLLTIGVFAIGQHAARRASKTPRFVTWTLAGSRLNNDDWDGVAPYRHDPRTGYYFVSAEDCFGTPRSFLLSPREGLDSISKMELAKIPQGKLDLRTGNHVAIGESHQQVESKLGVPLQNRSGRRTGERIYSYRYNFQKRKGVWQYRADYTFHANHLWAIRFERCWTPKRSSMGLLHRTR